MIWPKLTERLAYLSVFFPFPIQEGVGGACGHITEIGLPVSVSPVTIQGMAGGGGRGLWPHQGSSVFSPFPRSKTVCVLKGS